MSPIQQNKSVEVEIGPDGSGSFEVASPAQGISAVTAADPHAIVGVVPLDRGARARVDVAGCAPETTTTVSYFDASPPREGAAPEAEEGAENARQRSRR